jgi:hypothetical protein
MTTESIEELMPEEGLATWYDANLYYFQTSTAITKLADLLAYSSLLSLAQMRTPTSDLDGWYVDDTSDQYLRDENPNPPSINYFKGLVARLSFRGTKRAR